MKALLRHAVLVARLHLGGTGHLLFKTLVHRESALRRLRTLRLRETAAVLSRLHLRLGQELLGALEARAKHGVVAWVLRLLQLLLLLLEKLQEHHLSLLRVLGRGCRLCLRLLVENLGWTEILVLLRA